MPYALIDLEVDRVDLVDEGANSAAFIELFKRKECTDIMDLKEIISKMKPEHAEVVNAAIEGLTNDVAKATAALSDVTVEKDALSADLAKAKEDLEAANSAVGILKAKQKCECDGEADESGVCKKCGIAKASPSFDEEETLMKSLPQAARELIEKARTQKEAAETELRKAKEVEEHNEAVKKANELKALPIEHEKLVGIVKSSSPDVLDAFSSIAAAIEGTVLTEVGKSTSTQTTDNAWEAIEKKAEEIATRDNVTKQKAIATVIKECPDLYKQYLNGGDK